MYVAQWGYWVYAILICNGLNSCDEIDISYMWHLVTQCSNKTELSITYNNFTVS